jgi:hypothetical protein
MRIGSARFLFNEISPKLSQNRFSKLVFKTDRRRGFSKTEPEPQVELPKTTARTEPGTAQELGVGFAPSSQKPVPKPACPWLFLAPTS